MENQEEKFHKNYWLGNEPMKFADIMEKMNITKDIVNKLYESTKQRREETKNKRAIWLKKFPTNHMSFGDFLNKYGDTENAKCYYCGITEKQLNQAIEQGVIGTKRSGRGPSLEMDRKDPNQPYSNTNNIVFACYWCNNAKTDTFTEDESKIMGETIKKIWNTRLKQAKIDEIQ